MRPALPEAWEWMELRLPLASEWTRIRITHGGVEVTGSPLTSRPPTPERQFESASD